MELLPANDLVCFQGSCKRIRNIFLVTDFVYELEWTQKVYDLFKPNISKPITGEYPKYIGNSINNYVYSIVFMFKILKADTPCESILENKQQIKNCLNTTCWLLTKNQRKNLNINALSREHFFRFEFLLVEDSIFNSFYENRKFRISKIKYNCQNINVNFLKKIVVNLNRVLHEGVSWSKVQLYFPAPKTIYEYTSEYTYKGPVRYS